MDNDNDILYVQVVNRKIVIHTENESKIGPLTKQLELILTNFGFEKADSNKFVQVNKILVRDKKAKKIYFNRERTLYCTVTRPNLKKFFW